MMTNARQLNDKAINDIRSLVAMALAAKRAYNACHPTKADVAWNRGNNLGLYVGYINAARIIATQRYF